MGGLNVTVLFGRDSRRSVSIILILTLVIVVIRAALMFQFYWVLVNCVKDRLRFGTGMA